MKKGFTLVELLAVIAILGVIISITVPNVMGVIEKTRMSSFKTSVSKVLEMAISSAAEDGMYPITYNFFGELPDEITMKGNFNSWEGDIVFAADGSITTNLSNGRYCAKTSGTSREIAITDGACTTGVFAHLHDSFASNGGGSYYGGGDYSVMYGESYFAGPDPQNWIIFAKNLWRVVKASNEGIKIVFERSCTGSTVSTCTGTENGTIGIPDTIPSVNQTNKWDNANNSAALTLSNWYSDLSVNTSRVAPIQWCLGATTLAVADFDDIRGMDCTAASNALSGSGDYSARTNETTAYGLLRLSDIIIAAVDTTWGFSTSGYYDGSFNWKQLDISYLAKNYAFYLMTPTVATNNAYGTVYRVWISNRSWTVPERNYLSVAEYGWSGDIELRPVLNLDYDVLYASGNGTLASPYKIR